MTTRNHRCRFFTNNFVNNLSSSRITYSSQLSTFPFTNTQSNLRGKVWKTSGYFLIDSTNDKIYINDGTNKTVTLTDSSTAYTTPVLLAAHIQTKLNISSSGWTVSYSNTTYKFSISNSSSVTLRLSQATNAIWDTIGFNSSTDLTAMSFVPDSPRNHTSESVVFDLGSAQSMTFFSCIGLIDEIFSLSSSATVKLQANNINSWASTGLDLTLSALDNGIFRMLDDQADTAYRYWKFSFIDKMNPGGPQAFVISHIYLGDHITFDYRDVGLGYEKFTEDPSLVSSAESGAQYFDLKAKYSGFSGLQMTMLQRDNKDALEQIFKKLGKAKPFYFSIDPTLTYTDSIDELTKFVFFVDAPRFNHQFRDIFSTVLNLREVV